MVLDKNRKLSAEKVVDNFILKPFGYIRWLDKFKNRYKTKTFCRGQWNIWSIEKQ